MVSRMAVAVGSLVGIRNPGYHAAGGDRQYAAIMRTMFHDPFVAALALIGVVIIAASLLSGAVERSGVPQVAIFLLLGAMLGPAGLGVVELSLESRVARGARHAGPGAGAVQRRHRRRHRRSAGAAAARGAHAGAGHDPAGRAHRPRRLAPARPAARRRRDPRRRAGLDRPGPAADPGPESGAPAPRTPGPPTRERDATT